MSYRTERRPYDQLINPEIEKKLSQAASDFLAATGAKTYEDIKSPASIFMLIRLQLGAILEELKVPAYLRDRYLRPYKLPVINESLATAGDIVPCEQASEVPSPSVSEAPTPEPREKPREALSTMPSAAPSLVQPAYQAKPPSTKPKPSFARIPGPRSVNDISRELVAQSMGQGARLSEKNLVGTIKEKLHKTRKTARAVGQWVVAACLACEIILAGVSK